MAVEGYSPWPQSPPRSQPGVRAHRRFGLVTLLGSHAHRRARRFLTIRKTPQYPGRERYCYRGRGVDSVMSNDTKITAKLGCRCFCSTLPCRSWRLRSSSSETSVGSFSNTASGRLETKVQRRVLV